MCLSALVHAQQEQPNFVIVVVDDMGWSDTQPFGGEINTPNIASLAEQGVVMTDFYVAPTCSPTRSALLTGVDHHSAGLGTMAKMQAPNQVGIKGYQAELTDDVVTLAEVLQQQGYATMMTGKWHLALGTEQMPERRGFQQSFILKEGAASHFGDKLKAHQSATVNYFENGKPVDIPEDFYSTIHYTDKAIEYIKSADDSPFLAYIAYTAPHDPLQVPDAWLDRYKGKYDQGPEAIRQQRLQRQQAAGLIPKDIKLWQIPLQPEWLPSYKPAWGERSQQQRQQDVRAMEIYASMIEIVDQQIGRLLSSLEQQGKLDNTYVLFFSDNGASGATPLMYPKTSRQWFLTERDHSPANAGRPGSHVYMGNEWATASGTPWKLYKGSVAEGGIRSPFIVRGPGLPQGQRSRSLAHVMDIAPTLYKLIGVEVEDNALFADKQQPHGQSLLPFWRDTRKQEERTLAFELFGNRAVRSGRWKGHKLQPPLGSGKWELYDIVKDPAATVELSEQHPEILQGIIQAYDSYAQMNHVVPPVPQLAPNIADIYIGECNWWCEAKYFVVQKVLEFRK
ncbi:arylsulfatase AtsA [Maricurvus nonylphenolicus]